MTFWLVKSCSTDSYIDENHRVYNIGIGVHQGKGLYADTNIVTFAPLYEIDNQSSHRLAIAQRHIAMSEVKVHWFAINTMFW